MANNILCKMTPFLVCVRLKEGFLELSVIQSGDPRKLKGWEAEEILNVFYPFIMNNCL